MRPRWKRSPKEDEQERLQKTLHKQYRFCICYSPLCMQFHSNQLTGVILGLSGVSLSVALVHLLIHPLLKPLKN